MSPKEQDQYPKWWLRRINTFTARRVKRCVELFNVIMFADNFRFDLRFGKSSIKN